MSSVVLEAVDAVVGDAGRVEPDPMVGAGLWRDAAEVGIPIAAAQRSGAAERDVCPRAVGQHPMGDGVAVAVADGVDDGGDAGQIGFAGAVDGEEAAMRARRLADHRIPRSPGAGVRPVFGELHERNHPTAPVRDGEHPGQVGGCQPGLLRSVHIGILAEGATQAARKATSVRSGLLPITHNRPKHGPSLVGLSWLLLVGGLTPARAGNTRSSIACVASAWAYPREGGEHQYRHR